MEAYACAYVQTSAYSVHRISNVCALVAVITTVYVPFRIPIHKRRMRFHTIEALSTTGIFRESVGP